MLPKLLDKYNTDIVSEGYEPIPTRSCGPSVERSINGNEQTAFSLLNVCL